jgi:serine/threonine protein kinase
MQAGLGSQATVDQDAGASTPLTPDERAAATVRPSPRFPTPYLETLARQFPQLEMLELLGQGGMGVVYKARQRHLNRLVAVKILPPSVGEDPAFAERFTREAQALARLNHPNIVQIFDFGRTDEFFYFVMEYVDGMNLRALIRDGKLRPEEALKIVPQICEALQFAHDEGIVHRDIKPENILIDKRGRVKIADFGLAKLLGQVSEDLSLTGTGQLMGTLGYMAPEQLRHSNAVDHRADIYSLGVVFYEMLTGQLPIGRFEPPSKKVQVDVRLDEIVLHSLESEPSRRYQHASELKTDLETIKEFAAQPPRFASDYQTLESPRRRLGASIAEHPLLWTVAVFFSLPLLFALVGLAESVIAWRESSNPNPSMGGGPYPSMGSLIRPYANLIVLFGPFAFLTWAYLWRALHRGRMKRRAQHDQAATSRSSVTDGVRQAFQEWWTGRDKWFIKAAKTFLLVIYAVCLLMFFSVWASYSNNGWISEIGHPSPWFVLDKREGLVAHEHAEPGWEYRQGSGIEFRLISSSWLVAGFGFLAYYMYWRIRKAETGEQSKFRLPRSHALAWSIVGVAAFILCLSPMMIRTPSIANQIPLASSPVRRPVGSISRTWSLGPEGPRLNDGVTRNWLKPSQVAEVNRALQESYREYLALEKQNMKQSTDEQGHVTTVIPPLSKELSPIEGRLWSRLDAILDRDQQNSFRLNLELYPREAHAGMSLREIVRPGLFGWGQLGAQIEIRREGAWFRWNVSTGAWQDSSAAPELPEVYRRFWKEPSEKKTTAPSSL